MPSFTLIVIGHDPLRRGICVYFHYIVSSGKIEQILLNTDLQLLGHKRDSIKLLNDERNDFYFG